MELDVVDLDHVAIHVTDLDRALWFYHELLGMEIRDHEQYKRGEVPFVAVVAGGRHIHLVPTDTDDIDVGGEHICLLLRSETVDTENELRSLLAELQEHGVSVESNEPFKRYGAYGNAWAAYVRDPDNRRIELKLH